MNSTKEAVPVIFALEAHPLLKNLCQQLPAEEGQFASRAFPDGETYLRIETDVQSRDCIVLANLCYPNEKYLPLVFLAATLKELGANSVGLVAPYLCYMRQDRRFVDGEAVTSKIFAKQLSQQVDWLVTVDPHLHRYYSLDQIYDIPNRVVQGAPALAQWIKDQEQLFLVGPDAESEQWVSQIASAGEHPFVIGEKERRSDRDVVVSLPDLPNYTDQPIAAVIVDDVISSGQTIVKCVEALKEQGVENIRCIAVHGIFADDADKILMESGLDKLVTTNTISHSSNEIDMTEFLLEPILQCIQHQHLFE